MNTQDEIAMYQATRAAEWLNEMIAKLDFLAALGSTDPMGSNLTEDEKLDLESITFNATASVSDLRLLMERVALNVFERNLGDETSSKLYKQLKSIKKVKV